MHPLREESSQAIDFKSDSLFTDRPSDPRSTLPLSPDQHGGWIEAGKEVCIVGAEGRRDVLLWVRQQDIPLIQVGQSIELLLPEYFHETATAAVTEIASEPVDTVDRELVVSGLVELEPGADHERRPRGTMYQVRASLGTSAADLPSRLTARAQINVAAASLLERATTLAARHVSVPQLVHRYANNFVTACALTNSLGWFKWL